MKTAISLPDEVYASAQRLAKRLGMSRSELYTTALKSFLQDHRDDKVTEKLDEVYGEMKSELDASLRHLQSRSLTREKW